MEQEAILEAAVESQSVRATLKCITSGLGLGRSGSYFDNETSDATGMCCARLVMWNLSLRKRFAFVSENYVFLLSVLLVVHGCYAIGQSLYVAFGSDVHTHQHSLFGNSSLTATLWMTFITTLAMLFWCFIFGSMRQILIINPEIMRIEYVAFKRIALKEQKEWRGKDMSTMPEELSNPIKERVRAGELPARDKKKMTFLLKQSEKCAQFGTKSGVCAAVIAVLLIVLLILKDLESDSPDTLANLDMFVLQTVFMLAIGFFPCWTATGLFSHSCESMGFSNIKNLTNPIAIFFQNDEDVVPSEPNEALVYENAIKSIKFMQLTYVIIFCVSFIIMDDFFIPWAIGLGTIAGYNLGIAQRRAEHFCNAAFYNYSIASYVHIILASTNFLYLCLPNSMYVTFISSGWRSQDAARHFDLRLLIWTGMIASADTINLSLVKRMQWSTYSESAVPCYLRWMNVIMVLTVISTFTMLEIWINLEAGLTFEYYIYSFVGLFGLLGYVGVLGYIVSRITKWVIAWIWMP